MPFDQGTRNRLAGLVGAARAKLVQEFMRQLQSDYGLDPATGAAADLDSLRHLDDAGRETARILRETWRHYLAAAPRDGRDAKAQRDALDRIVREQAFTVLNRLCALRMAEARGLLIESVGRGHDSSGFALYRHVAGPALGETGDAYRVYLFSVFDELAVDLPALFDRYSPQGRLFPRDTVLRELLALLNAPDIEPLWAEDETIGWVYQYFNSVEERRQMRAESAAPRNSRELAVRNQFFTPRYVVEFLTDNTLGRIWYEMTRGETALVDACRYLVRRPLEIFLNGDDYHAAGQGSDWLGRVRAGEWAALADDPTEMELAAVALMIDGYEVASHVGIADLLAWAGERVTAFEHTGVLPTPSLELWLLLFALQHQWRTLTGSGPAGEAFLSLWRRVYHELKAALLNPPADLSQEELLRQPVFVPHRPPKDPRDIKLLDPACGSMHFGLYAFDLFERIYDEAWAIEASRGARALARPDGLQPLTELYADEAAFRRDVPRLILAHNLHGIDIDPRAVQIAGLSLWLRAQRSWRDQGVAAAERPAITRAHVVCAEPMPGEREMLAEFVKELPHQIVGELVARVFDEMKLAGEAGALLKIEETLRGAIEAARVQYHAELLRRRHDAGYLPGLAPERATTLLDLMELPDPEAFWATVEEQVLAALRDFATINGDGSYQRRLFADDAARGFAFIDLCRQRYDVVVMNPPFGLSQGKLYEYTVCNYPSSYIDLLASFVVRAKQLNPGGLTGAITSRACLYTKTLLDWRTENLSGRISSLADLGIGVLDDALVRSCAYVINAGDTSVNGYFIDARKTDDKNAMMLSAVEATRKSTTSYLPIFIRDSDYFELVPQRRIIYWLPQHFWETVRNLPSIEPNGATIRAGLTTYDDWRFIRLRWEVEPQEIGLNHNWVFLSKGGYYGTYYNDIHLVVLWADDGKEVGAFNRERYSTDAQSRRGSKFYFQAAGTYSRRTDFFSARALPVNCFFSDKGPAILPIGKSTPEYVLGLFNSDLFRGLIHSQSQGGCFETGVLKILPWIEPSDETQNNIGEIVVDVWKTKTRIFSLFETNALFVVPAGIAGSSLSEQATDIRKFVDLTNERNRRQTVEINSTISHLYGLTSNDFEDLDVYPHDHDIKEAENVADSDAFIAESLLSYLTGCVFGRWDIRYATGERQPPELPDPFAPLPACPPGMLQNAAGLPAAPGDLPDDYPLRISWPGILVDDEGHPEDIVGRVRQALAVIWPESADAIEAEACAILGVASLRDYFARPDRFFADHLGRYSKSRRAAPIYWPLSSANGAYTVWLYYHRLNDQTPYHAVNDFLDPKLRRVADDGARLRARGGRSRAEERELERLVDLEAELRSFREELLRVAGLWRPNLNDGVEITAAPLWRLFRHRPWQKRLRQTWEKLEAGDYDWAHLAYAVWPDRVREKCRGDKSLAIAHDLEHLYVAPPDAARKKRRAAAAEEETVDVE